MAEIHGGIAMSKQDNDKKKQSVDFSVKATWLAIAKMYNVLGAEHGITHSNGFVLLNIDKEHGTPATKIAPLMGMEARSLSRMLKTMEEEGMIYRQQDEKDRRKVLICLTEEGKIKREASRQVVKEFNKRVREAVSEEKMQVFFEVIDKINEVVESYKMPTLELDLDEESLAVK
ncbi:MarR family winged helix-turn-helix transcriptional regulator [Rhodoflexus caldus]|uniref:MarR family winged helix-turn-helix transcriptional regulator n=1 Tax=Rhodoflexus caldus TaxID=2891236 RepID=UPI00293F0474|nr:MarR family transcriptional regulator [Rhodoflexus caldus]